MFRLVLSHSQAVQDCIKIKCLYNIVEPEGVLTRAETRSCNYVFNKEVLSLMDMYWFL
jgi:hypothetical protein